VLNKFVANSYIVVEAARRTAQRPLFMHQE